jgi:hypothetical protein
MVHEQNAGQDRSYKDSEWTFEILANSNIWLQQQQIRIVFKTKLRGNEIRKLLR